MARSRRTRAPKTTSIEVPRRSRAALLDEVEAALTRTRETTGELEVNELASRLSVGIEEWAREHAPRVADELHARFGGKRGAPTKDDVGPEKQILKAIA